MANSTDYYQIEPDPAKDPPDYTTNERRAEVLDFILSKRSPKEVSRTRLADRYDVAVSTITRDIQRLSESLSDVYSREEAVLETRALREEIVADLMAEDSWRAKKAALDCHLDWVAFLGYDEVFADVGDGSEDEDGVKRGKSPGGLDEETKAALDRAHENAKKATEPFLVKSDSSSNSEDNQSAQDADRDQWEGEDGSHGRRR